MKGTSLILAGLALAGGALLLSRTASASEGTASKSEPRDLSGRRELIERYLRQAEELTGVDGLTTFGLAAARGESSWSPAAHNGSESERSAASRLFAGALGRGFFAQSTYLDSDVWGSGSWGWFGLLPATALSARGLQEADPAILTMGDAPESLALQVAAFVDMLSRLSQYQGEQSWGDLRAGMASLRAMANGGAKSKAALAEDLAAIDAPEDFAEQVPSFASYRARFGDASDLYVAIFEGQS